MIFFSSKIFENLDCKANNDIDNVNEYDKPIIIIMHDKKFFTVESHINSDIIFQN